MSANGFSARRTGIAVMLIAASLPVLAGCKGHSTASTPTVPLISADQQRYASKLCKQEAKREHLHVVYGTLSTAKDVAGLYMRLGKPAPAVWTKLPEAAPVAFCQLAIPGVTRSTAAVPTAKPKAKRTGNPCRGRRAKPLTTRVFDLFVDANGHHTLLRATAVVGTTC